MTPCIPCEAKKALQKAKLSFLIETAQQRAAQQQTDYAIYTDSESNTLKLAEFSQAVSRGETIVQIVSRFEGVNA
jgi:hypothetical protein